MTEPIRMVRQREACEILCVCRVTLRAMELRGDITPTQVVPGRKGKRYRLSMLERYLDRKTRPAK